MLLYSPPFIESGRLTLFRDDSSNTTFYYASTRPAIALDVNGKPKIFASVILPESGVVEERNEGFVESSLSMDVTLQPSATELGAAKEAIQEHWGKQAVILAPAPVVEGTVHMVVAAVGEEPNPGEWYVTPKVSPSILGGNNASLIARAEGEHAKHLIASLNEDLFTASIFYQLSILA